MAFGEKKKNNCMKWLYYLLRAMQQEQQEQEAIQNVKCLFITGAQISARLK